MGGAIHADGLQLDQKIEKLKQDIAQGLQEEAGHEGQDASHQGDQMEGEGEYTQTSPRQHCTPV